MLAVCLVAATATGLFSGGMHRHAARLTARALAPLAKSPTSAAAPPTSAAAPPTSAAPRTSPSPQAAAARRPAPGSRPHLPTTTTEQAAEAISAFDRAFYRRSGGRGLFAQTTSGGVAQFWRQAEMLEVVEDAYARSHGSVYRRMIGELRAGIAARYGTDWLRDAYNDDVMWMVIAYLRAYELTGDRSYRSQARRAFDGVYGRAHDGTFGGGLWWTTDRHEKNACVNAPAAIAACLLARDLHAPSYLQKARGLFAWLTRTLYDPGDGAVYDHIARGGSNGVVDHSTYTYNQGTFIGAADLLGDATGLSTYRRQACLTLRFARERLTVGGVLRSEGSGGDGGGFKGIFARWAARFVIHHGLTDDAAWLDANAAAAWSCHDRRGLIGEDWCKPTSPGMAHALDCSSAVALLQDRP